MTTEKKILPLTPKQCEWPLEHLLNQVDDFAELNLDLLFVLDDALEAEDGDSDVNFTPHRISRYYKLLAFLQQLSLLQQGKEVV